jgi:hypothetical protein
MIRFPCHCGHLFNLTEDQAGGMIQCPLCGRLNDIPTLSDLENLESDGSFKVQEQVLATDPDHMPEVHRAFTRSHFDARGQEIDLRPSVDDILRAGTSETFELADDAESAKPKYDPFTGELVRPLDVKHEEQPREVPMAKAAITYAAGAQRQHTTASTILLELLAPMNAIVMVFVFLFYFTAGLANLFMTWIANLFLAIPVMFINPIIAMIIAHYANIVDETGPEQKDELPRPLRNLSFHEDLWWPFRNFMGAVFLCYGPLIVLWMNREHIPLAEALAIMLMVSGTFFFPAVLLTTLSSGTVANLRPDRLLGVIRACGGAYLLLVLAWGAVWPIFMVIFGGPYVLPSEYLQRPFEADAFGEPPVVLMMTIVNLYLAHFFFWYLGLNYRRHHMSFPWVMQRHISTRKDALAQLEQRRLQRQHQMVEQPEKRP